tara:strand:- start:3872 stop:4996 length:1125 start_codon:yes stop_codon:yes gene_type:complete
MKKNFLLLLFVFGCGSSSNIVEDFFVPEIPFPIENIDLNNDNLFGQTREYQFSLFKTKFNFELSLDTELYDQVKYMSKENGIKSGDGIRQDQYDVFIYDNSDEEILNDILSTIKNREGRLDYDIVQILVSFVQSIEYDKEADLPKYTLETLNLNKGDCDDKSILLSKLLSYAGYETCLFIYEKGQHMAVGLKIDNNIEAYKDGFVYIETTGNSPIGKIPDEFAGGVSIIDEEPVLLYVDVIGSNYEISGFNELNNFYKEVENIYGVDYFYNSFDGKILVEEIYSYKTKSVEIKNLMNLDEIKIKKFRNKINNLGGCSGTLEKEIYELCLPLNDSLNTVIDNYNSLVQKFNSENSKLNKLISDYNDLNSDNYIKS